MTWIDQYGNIYDISQMTNRHLVNTINMLDGFDSLNNHQMAMMREMKQEMDSRAKESRRKQYNLLGMDETSIPSVDALYALKERRDEMVMNRCLVIK